LVSHSWVGIHVEVLRQQEVRKIFGQKREEVKKEGAGDCKEVHEEDILE